MERSCVHIAVLVVAEDPAAVDLANATFMSDKVTGQGHRIVAQEIVEDDETAIRDQLSRWIGLGHIDVVVSAGADDATVAALGPLVTKPLPGLTDQLRLLARDRGSSSRPVAARCSSKFVFLLPPEVSALGAALNQLILPQLDSTAERNLVKDMPRHGGEAIPHTVAAEKTVTGAGLAPKIPAEPRNKRKTGANIVARNEARQAAASSARPATGSGPASGSSPGSGNGPGSGSGRGSGHGPASGNGPGSGSGPGSGGGSGNGPGSGPGSGNGPGSGSGGGSGNSPGSGRGSGNGSGSGGGSGNGRGSGGGSGPASGQDATRVIDRERLERQLARSANPAHDAVTRPHIDLATMLPPVPPGADERADTEEELAGLDRDPTLENPIAPVVRTVQPARLRGGPGPIGTAKSPARPSTADEAPTTRAAKSANEARTTRAASASPADEAPTTRAAPKLGASSASKPVAASAAASKPVPSNFVTSRLAASAPVVSTPAAGSPIAKPATIPSIAAKPAGPAATAAPATTNPLPKPTPVSSVTTATPATGMRVPQGRAAGGSSNGQARAKGSPSPIAEVRPADLEALAAKATAEDDEAGIDAASSADLIEASSADLIEASSADRIEASSSDLIEASSADLVEAASSSDVLEASSADLEEVSAQPSPSPSSPSPSSPSPSPSPSRVHAAPILPSMRPAGSVPPAIPQRPATGPAAVVPQRPATGPAAVVPQRPATGPSPIVATSAAPPPAFTGPELLDLREGTQKKRRSRTGTALVRKNKRSAALMFIALAGAAVAGFFVVVHFFPQFMPGADSSANGSAVVAMQPAGSNANGSAAIGAAGSTTEAAGSATEAAGSATGAAGSATEAAGSATGAAGSATEAAGSEVAEGGPAPEPAGSSQTHEAAANRVAATPQPPTTTRHAAAHHTTGGAVTHPDMGTTATAKAETAKTETAKTETAKTEAAPPPTEDGCDEVSCVMDHYEKACCARFKPADGGFHPKGSVPDQLDRSMVKEGIEKVKPAVVACGEKIAVKGEVKLAITVAPAGNVQDISVVEAPSDALGTCVMTAVKRARFGKATSATSFNYPFAF